MNNITEKEFKILTAEKYASMKRKRHPITDKLLKLKVGEGLQIEFDEWTGKTAPSLFCSQLGIRHNIKIRTRQLVDGYAFLRVK